MSTPTLEIVANVGTAEKPKFSGFKRTEPVSQRVLSAYFESTPEELNVVAKLHGIPQIFDDSGSNGPAIFYEIRQVLPLLRGLKEISDEGREWLLKLDLDQARIEANFPNGSKFIYYEEN